MTTFIETTLKAKLMSNHLSHLLNRWLPNKDQCEWVLGTIYDHDGPCYRKTGAMMLFNSFGQQLGMLSGGCLESDIGINARKVMQTGQSMLLCYDGNDEDDMSFQLGIGCGGTVYIMLQRINADNNYLELGSVFQALKTRKTGVYHQQIVDKSLANKATFEFDPDVTSSFKTTSLLKVSKNKTLQWLSTPIIPEQHILIAGGGLDAKPMVEIAYQLGWRISLWDPRPANARKEHFLKAHHIIQGNDQVLAASIKSNQFDAAIVMTHNINLDAKAVVALSSSNIKYLALLGPAHRKQQVLIQANLQSEALPFPIAGPAGLDIGGELPESIALSILSECHATLKARQGGSMSHVLSSVVRSNELQIAG